MNPREPVEALRPGEIAFFFDLWPNTAKQKGPHPTKQRTFVFEIEGKARPMLVLDRLDRQYDTRWYRVLRITTKPNRGDGRRREECYRLGRCVNPDKESYVVLEPLVHPETLLQGESVSHAPIKPLDRVVFDNVFRILTDRLLRR